MRLAATVVAAIAALAPAPSVGATDRATQIAIRVDARYPGLRVTEASSTAVIESFTLFDGVDARVVPAERGIYFSVCPNRATCPYPSRAARPATSFVPRRVALELAARTFLETTADLVVVSLPTRRFTLLVLERQDLNAQAVSEVLAGYAPVDHSQALRTVVDRGTLPHLYEWFGLDPTASGRETLLAVALTQAP